MTAARRRQCGPGAPARRRGPCPET